MPGSERNTWPLVGTVLVVALPVVYFLSTAAAVRISMHTNALDEFFIVVYAPILWLAEYTPLGPALQKWFEFWAW